MKKIVAVAALIAATFAVPALPVQAQPVLPEISENCLIFPILKRRCWKPRARRGSRPAGRGHPGRRHPARAARSAGPAGAAERTRAQPARATCSTAEPRLSLL